MQRADYDVLYSQRRMFVTDPLTGTANRCFLIKHLPRELERSRRYNHPLAIISCDIDYFKRINDSFGHDAGDEVLQALVARSRTCIRQAIDWIARSCGEEFVFVLPETSLNGASRIAYRLRKVLSGEPMSTCAGELAITVSIGVTALETAQELKKVSAAELLRTVDRCLYASKRLGGDRATAASADDIGTVMPEVYRRAHSEIH
jgi:two-component system cell cycle response regulator